MLKAALFDFDGTIFHSEQVHQAVIQQVIEEYFGTTVDEDELRAHLGLRYEDRLRQMLAMRGIDDEQLVDELNLKAQALQQVNEDPEQMLVPGVRECITDLHAAGIRLAVVSSSMHQYIEERLRITNLRDPFEYIIGADDVTCRKPHPEPYEKALAQLGITAKEAIVFEDTPQGIEAASLAGLPVIGLLTSFHEEDLVGTVHTMHDYTNITLGALQAWVK